MHDLTYAGPADHLGALTPIERCAWARHVLRHRAAIVSGLAVTGARMVRRAEAILGSADG